jgi:hypothetical protein
MVFFTTIALAVTPALYALAGRDELPIMSYVVIVLVAFLVDTSVGRRLRRNLG